MTDRDLLVLVVDDDPTIREALALRGEDWGYQTCTASNLAEAETLLAERDPDLVVADVVLPDASELEQLRRLRADGSDRPVILVTAHGSIDLAVEAMKKGAYDFFTKPLDAEKLKALLASAASELEQRERIRAPDEDVGELVSPPLDRHDPADDPVHALHLSQVASVSQPPAEDRGRGDDQELSAVDHLPSPRALVLQPGSRLQGT